MSCVDLDLIFFWKALGNFESANEKDLKVWLNLWTPWKFETEEGKIVYFSVNGSTWRFNLLRKQTAAL